MADETKMVTKVEDIITCALCREVLREPKTFFCLHSFCQACIESLELTTEEKDQSEETGAQDATKQGYSCPLCRHFTPQENVRVVHLITQLVDAYHASRSTTRESKCNRCASKNAKWHCMECATNAVLCDGCKTLHDEFVRHELVALEDLRSTEKLVERPRYCDEHKAYKIEVHCAQCEKVICVMCKILHHEGHRAQPISEAVKRLLEKVKDNVEVLEDDLDLNIKDIEKLKEEKRAMVKKYDIEVQDLEDKVAQAKQVKQLVDAATTKTQGLSLMNEFQDGLLAKLEHMAKDPGELDERGRIYASKCWPWSLDNFPHVLKSTQTVPPDSTRLAILWDRVWVFNNSNTVKCFSLDGTPGKDMHLSAMNNTLAGIQVDRKYAIIASQSGLYQINKRGQLITQVCGGLISDVCLARDGLLYGLDNASNILRCYKFENSSWVTKVSFTLQGYAGYQQQSCFGSFVICNKLISITNRASNQVLQFTLPDDMAQQQGSVTLQQKTPPLSMNNLPAICGMAPGLQLYVAVFQNRRLEVYSGTSLITQHTFGGQQMLHAIFQDSDTIWVLNTSNQLQCYSSK